MKVWLETAPAHREGLYKTMGYNSDTASSALAHLHGGESTEGVRAAIRDTPANTKEALRDLKADEAMTRRALELIGSRRNNHYEAAVAALREDTRDWWANGWTATRTSWTRTRPPISPTPTICSGSSRPK